MPSQHQSPQVTTADFQAAFRNMNTNLEDLNRHFNELFVDFDKSSTIMIMHRTECKA